MASVAKVFVIRLKGSSRRQAGTEVPDIFFFLFCLIFPSCGLLNPLQKEQGKELHLSALFTLFLGTKSPPYPFVVPGNLGTSEVHYKVLLCYWLLLAVLLWYETLVHCAGQTVLVCLCLD